MSIAREHTLPTTQYPIKVSKLFYMNSNIKIIIPKRFLFLVKQINRQLIAVAQFICSVLAGFAFGFIGIELMVGTLDFGFRLLLGIICALVVALAEIYFLAKKLNEDIDYEEAHQNWLKSKSQIPSGVENSGAGMKKPAGGKEHAD